jgi:hypothetical protein
VAALFQIVADVLPSSFVVIRPVLLTVIARTNPGSDERASCGKGIAGVVRLVLLLEDVIDGDYLHHFCRRVAKQVAIASSSTAVELSPLLVRPRGIGPHCCSTKLHRKLGTL